MFKSCLTADDLESKSITASILEKPKCQLARQKTSEYKVTVINDDEAVKNIKIVRVGAIGNTSHYQAIQKVRKANRIVRKGKIRSKGRLSETSNTSSQ